MEEGLPRDLSVSLKIHDTCFKGNGSAGTWRARPPITKRPRHEPGPRPEEAAATSTLTLPQQRSYFAVGSSERERWLFKEMVGD